MARKKRTDSEQLIYLLRKSGIVDNRIERTQPDTDDTIADLGKRIQQTIELIKSSKNKRHTMLYFVMYDIENNKVRRLIARYLERKGLVRIQKSIFVANTEPRLFEEIRQTLKEVQEAYDNHDSIVLVPISADELRSMKIIGKNIDLDLIAGESHTLIF